MTPDQVAAVRQIAYDVLHGETGDCTCIPAYAERGLIDPECAYHEIDPDFCADEIAKKVAEALAPTEDK